MMQPTVSSNGDGRWFEREATTWILGILILIIGGLGNYLLIDIHSQLTTMNSSITGLEESRAADEDKISNLQSLTTIHDTRLNSDDGRFFTDELKIGALEKADPPHIVRHP